MKLKSNERLVAVYEVTRMYGGPEEGGWWYDWTHIVMLRKFSSLRKAQKAKYDARRMYPKEHFNRHSCAGNADTYVEIHTSADKVWEETTARPTYF